MKPRRAITLPGGSARPEHLRPQTSALRSVTLIARVPSLTHNGLSYEIRRHRDGLSCSCPSFQYGRGGADCKHLIVYRMAKDALARCAHVGGRALCPQCLVNVLARFVALTAGQGLRQARNRYLRENRTTR